MGPATPLAIGTVIEATVTDVDPKCYRNWDLNAGCRWFRAVPSESGDFTVTLRPGRLGRPRGSLDLFANSGGGTVAWFGTGTATFPVVAGSEIDILVMAYEFPEPFVLETAIR
jgi:hypothetical protein